MECNICGEIINLESLNEVLQHEHKNFPECNSIGHPISKTYQDNESVNVKSISFEKKNNTFDLTYRNGKVYRYLDFEESLFKQAIESTHIGKFLNDHVKGNFRFVQI